MDSIDDMLNKLQNKRQRTEQKCDAFWVSGPNNTIRKYRTHFRKIQLISLLINSLLNMNAFTIN